LNDIQIDLTPDGKQAFLTVTVTSRATGRTSVKAAVTAEQLGSLSAVALDAGQQMLDARKVLE